VHSSGYNARRISVGKLFTSLIPPLTRTFSASRQFALRPAVRLPRSPQDRDRRAHVDPTARLMTDENHAYIGLGNEFAGGHAHSDEVGR
jgi:hypothetical protein